MYEKEIAYQILYDCGIEERKEFSFCFEHDGYAFFIDCELYCKRRWDEDLERITYDDCSVSIIGVMVKRISTDTKEEMEIDYSLIENEYYKIANL